jgi:hypothetical protein
VAVVPVAVAGAAAEAPLADAAGVAVELVAGVEVGCDAVGGASPGGLCAAGCAAGCVAAGAAAAVVVLVSLPVEPASAIATPSPASSSTTPMIAVGSRQLGGRW